MKKSFRMVDHGSVFHYLGMIVTQENTSRILRFGQVGYLEQVFQTYGMWNCKPIATHINLSLVADATDYKCTSKFRLQYQSAVDSLMYAMRGTQPDLAFAVFFVSRHASHQDFLHLQTVKHIFRYLEGNLKLQLTF